jgi:hypothetical protein
VNLNLDALKQKSKLLRVACILVALCSFDLGRARRSRFNLQGQHFFDGGIGGGFKDAFFFQEVVEFASSGHDDGLSLKINPLFGESNVLHQCGGSLFGQGS